LFAVAVVVIHMWFELMWLFVVVALQMRMLMWMWMSLFVAHSRNLLSTIQQELRPPKLQNLFVSYSYLLE